MNAVLGVAGHIDHGKTALVAALTGINCDRLPEERRRGITIELGFAWLDLPNGSRLGIIDAPGHERFVKTMLAGASGIDCLMLVVAADEGVMPQTREHLDICSLLGIRRGLVALTKIDLVDEDWLALVEEDIRALCKGSFLEDAPIYRVSASAQEGIEKLKQGIFDLVSDLNAPMRSEIFRLPIDRVFSMKGFGTVVTGTIVSGACRQGEDLYIMPGQLRARARSLQAHGEQVSEAHQGQRCAINLQGLDVEQLHRGDIVTHANSLFASRRWVVQLSNLPSTPLPIRNRMEAHFHHGAKECAAKVVFKDREELAPGQSAVAELLFDQPMSGIYGDRCVLRAHSPLRAIAGATLLDPLPAPLRKRDPAFSVKWSLYQELASLDPTAEQILLNSLALRPLPGANERELAALCALPPPMMLEKLAKLEKSAEIFCWDKENRCWIGPQFNECVTRCVARARSLHERDPLKLAFAASALAAGWADNLPDRFLHAVLTEALKRGLLSQDANGWRLAIHEPKLAADQKKLLDELPELYAQCGLTPPLLKELCEERQLDARRLLPVMAHLCATGRLVKIQDGLYYHREKLQSLFERLENWFKNNPVLEVADMKALFNLSRKYAIPLLEYMDSIKMTIRMGNQRKLASRN